MKYEKREIKHEIFNRHEVLEKLMPIVENTAMRFGVIPVEVDLTKENKHWFLRIFIFAKDREITLEDCENMSRSLGEFTDELIPVKFNLEISSPGLERKLKSDKEYLIFEGKDINLKLKHGIDDDCTKFVCKIVDFDEKQGLTVYSYKDKKEITIPKDNIVRAELYAKDL